MLTARLASLILIAGVAAAVTPPANSNLTGVLAQMDASSKSFHTTEANVKKEQYDHLIKETDTETGTMYYQRVGNNIQMGAKFDPPAAQIVEYKNGIFRLYQPQSNHLETRTASGADQAKFQAGITIGFGGTGSELAKAWDITDQGSETIDGVKVEKLDLVSKDPSVRNNYSHITIWIDPARDISLKQKFFAPNNDTNTITFSNIRYNQPIRDMGAYAIKCKGKCD